MSGAAVPWMPGERPLDELTLLRSFVTAQRRYQTELDRVRAAMLVGDAIEGQELLELERERNALLKTWEVSFGRRERPTVPENLRAAGAV